jgi:hypothetical protein
MIYTRQIEVFLPKLATLDDPRVDLLLSFPAQAKGFISHFVVKLHLLDHKPT